MKTSGSMPYTAVTDPELAALMERPGPFVTVYLTTDAEQENAAQRSEQHWKALRAEVSAQGAPDELLERIDPFVADAHLEGQCLGVVVSADGHVHVEHHAEVPPRDVGRWSPLPVLAPLIEWRQQSVPYVVVLADRQGADLFAFRRDGAAVVREAGGDDHPVHKVPGGGWSARRYQQRVENTWDHNAADAAQQVSELVTRTQARAVVVAGDVRAVQLLREHLPSQVDELVRVIDGGRSPDGSDDEITAEAARLVATVVASDTRTVLERFREERGQHDQAADGPPATIAALNESRVEVLLVPGEAEQMDSAWFGADPVPVALSPETLHEMGVEDPQHAPLTDVLIRAALGTGAGVRVIPPAAAPSAGIGALLRW